MEILISVLVGLAIGFALGRSSRLQARSFQNDGEARLSREIRAHFPAPTHHLLNHVTLQLQDGTTQIDHILISRFGIFVIETKDYSGWIFGNSRSTNWTQVLFSGKYQFQNPILQNFRHVKAVQHILDFLPADCVKSVVVFAGKAEFKTENPTGVFHLPQLIDYLDHQTAEVMSQNRMQFCIGRLEASRLAVSNETDIEHVENLRRRHGGSN